MKKVTVWLKKILRWSLVTFILLLVIVLGAAYYFLATESGIKQLIEINNKYSPAKINVEHFSGNFAGDITLTNLSVTHSQFELTSEEAQFSWQPKALFNLNLIIEQLRLKNSKLTLLANDQATVAETPTDSQATELNDISLPIDIFINQLAVDGFSIINQQSSTEIEQLLIKLHYQDSELTLENLQFSMPDPMVKLTSHGTLSTKDDYPLTLNNELTTDIANFGAQNFTVTSQGNLKTTLTNLIQSSDDLNFALNNKLNNLLNDPTLSGDLQVHSINLAPFQLGSSTLSANLTYQGSFSDINLTGEVNYASPDSGPLKLELDSRYQNNQIAIHNILLSLLTAQQQLALSGNFDLNNMRFEADLKSDQLGWPQTNPFVNLATLQGSISGTPDDYQLQLNSSLSGEGLPTVQFDLNTNGSTSGLRQFSLHNKLLDGELIASGEFDWQPYLNLKNAKIISNHINPASLVAELSGDINSDIDLTFNNENNTYQATLLLNKLDGTLQQHPINGSGEVFLKDNALDIKQLSIDLANNLLTANGVLSQEKADIDFTLAANQPSNLLPELTGKANLSGNIKGSLQKPAVNVSGTASDLSYQGQSVKAVNLKTVFDLATENIDIAINAKQLTSGQTVVENTDLTIKGSLSNHNINATVDADIAQLALAADGGLDLNTQQWQGELTTLSITEDKFGQWKLRQPTALQAGKTDVRIGDFCLAQDKTALCIKGDYKVTEGNGAFSVIANDISSDLIKPYLPQMIELTTTLGLVSDIKLANNQPTVTGKLSQQGGQLTLKSPGKDVQSSIQTFNIDFKLENNKLDVSAALVLEKLLDIALNASLNNIQKTQFSSEMAINQISFAPFQPLVPMLDSLNGEIKGKLEVNGAYDGNMQLSGGINLENGQFNVPEYGTQISEINLQIDAQSATTLAVSGGLKAGQGKLNINGTVEPFKPAMDITIKGSDLNVANTNKLDIDISPDLAVILDDRLHINGEVVIPRARISPESSGSKVNVSEDVVIQNQEMQKEATSPIEANIDIKLGDDVKISSADIETQLYGGINLRLEPNQAPSASGTIEVKTGEYRVYGQKLRIDRGRIIFGKGAVSNPRLDIRVSREIEDDDVTVGANILGHVQQTKIDLFSTPGMPDSSILSYLLFGKAPSSDTFSQTAVMQTGALIGANTMAKNLKESTGLDVLEFSLSGFEAGKNITDKLYTGIESNFFQNISEFLMRYRFNKRFSFETNVGTEDSGFDFIYSYEKD